MFFNLPDFLDSIVGLHRGEAVRLIAVEVASIEEYNRIAIFDLSQEREFSRELGFLKALAQEILTPGYSGVWEVDRPIVNEFVATLKPDPAVEADTPIETAKPAKKVKATKAIKSTKTAKSTKAAKPTKTAKTEKPAKAAKKAAPAKKTAAKKSTPKK